MGNTTEERDAKWEEMLSDIRQKGYFILPLPVGKKFPPPTGWIDREANDYPILPDQNVAIATKNRVGILITNDERSAEWARKTFGRENVKSRRGGHWYFRTKEGQQNEANRETSVGTMEFHAHNKYALIPPSIHPEGTPYEWVKLLPPIEELPEVPNDLNELFHPPGTHHDELLRYSAAMGYEGFSVDDITANLKKKRSFFPDPQKHPDKELRGMAETAFIKFHDKGQKGSEGGNGNEIDRQLIERIKRLTRGLAKYKEYIDSTAPSRTADKIQTFIRFMAKKAASSSVERMPLYSFDKFYKPDGEARIASELERIRRLMLSRAKEIHQRLDGAVEAELEKINITDVNHPEQKELKKLLLKFLELPGTLNIKNTYRQEIASSLAARNLKDPSELNVQPPGLICRIALKDYTLEMRSEREKVIASLVPFNPDHYLTYALNASLTSPGIKEQSKRWFDFSCRVFGVEGTKLFYEFVGFLMVTSYPQLTERNILVIVGDPGSGKGTHLGAVEALLSFGTTTLYAKVDPHKLADPREHFSRQNLAGKLALISGDMLHKRIHDFSPINDLFGGEPFESEVKYKSPTNEIPIFKGLFASTLPLFKITTPGGAWRRILLSRTTPIDEAKRDAKIKPRMLNQLDGFFLNALIGLSYLVANDWKFTGELHDDEVESLWTDLSDSIRVWAEGRLTPEDPKVEMRRVVKSSLEGTTTELTMVDNTENMLIIDELYSDYVEWCHKKQIEQEKKQNFSAWLRHHDFEVRRRLIEEGEYRGKRKYVIFAAYDPDPIGTLPETKLDASSISWETYFSESPITITSESNMLGQTGWFQKKK